MAAVAFGGFLDAAYLSLRYFQGLPPVCTLLHGCAIVTASRYAAVGPVPVAVLGAAYYLLILALAVGYLDLQRLAWLRLASAFTVVGFSVSAVLVYLQLVVLRAVCLYCFLSAVSSLLLFILGCAVLASAGCRSRTYDL